MDPKVQQEVERLQDLVDGLQGQLDMLKSNSTIPNDIGEAMKARVLTDVNPVAISSKSSTSENQAVNESGASSYSVLKAPDGFLETTINGTTYYIPYFS